MNNHPTAPVMYLFDEKIVKKMKKDKIVLSMTKTGGLMISERYGKFESDDRSVSKFITGLKSAQRPNKISPNDYTLRAFGDIEAAKLRKKERMDKQKEISPITGKPTRKYTKRQPVNPPVNPPVTSPIETKGLTLTFNSGASVNGSATDIKELLTLLELG